MPNVISLGGSNKPNVSTLLEAFKSCVKASASICRSRAGTVVVLATASVFGLVALVIEFIYAVSAIISSDELHISR